MRLDPQLVEDLRSLFRKGATPSRIIREILDSFPNEPRIEQLIRAYFREAFLVPMLRFDLNAVKQGEVSALAILNESVIHRMVEKRLEWDSAARMEDGRNADWMRSLAAPDDADLIRQFDPANVPELSQSWDQLDQYAQRYIRRLFGNAQGLYQRVQMLSALAEQLQLQVNALESQSQPGQALADGLFAGSG